MVAAMDEVGVDGAVLVSPFSTCTCYDASYAIEVHKARTPAGSGWSKPVDPNDPGVADTIANWKATKGTVGVRIMMRDNVSTDPADPGINRVLAAAARHSLSVNFIVLGLSRNRPGRWRRATRTRRSSSIISGCSSRSSRRRRRAAAVGMEATEGAGAGAAHPNVAIKVSGACTLSHQRISVVKDHLGPARSYLRRLWHGPLHGHGAPTGPAPSPC